MISYLTLSYFQQYRATLIVKDIIADRNHVPTRLIVKPSFANIIVWKTLYEFDDYYYMDAIRLTTDIKFITGAKTKKLIIEESFPWLNKKSQQAMDLERFRWFSDNYLSQSLQFPYQIMDVRFTSLPHTISPLWSIELNPEAQTTSHVKYVTNRKVNDRKYSRLFDIILNR